MNIGDLVKASDGIDCGENLVGIITCIDPEGINDEEEVEVLWNDGDRCNHSTWLLELINASR